MFKQVSLFSFDTNTLSDFVHYMVIFVFSMTYEIYRKLGKKYTGDKLLEQDVVQRQLRPTYHDKFQLPYKMYVFNAHLYSHKHDNISIEDRCMRCMVSYIFS